MRSVVSNIRSYAPLLEESLSIGFYLFFFFIWPTISIKMYLYSIVFFCVVIFGWICLKWKQIIFDLILFKRKPNGSIDGFATSVYIYWKNAMKPFSSMEFRMKSESFQKYGVVLWWNGIGEILILNSFRFHKNLPGPKYLLAAPSYVNPYFSSRMVFITFVRSFPFEYLHEHNSQRWKK